MNIFIKGNFTHTIFIWMLLSSSAIQAQHTYTLDECYTLAKNNFPLIKQKELIAKSNEYNISNIEKGILPQVNFSGQNTYQSAVTSISIPIPGFNFQAPPKDQYKVYGEVDQPLTDLYTVKQQKKLQEANSKIQQQSLEVELYKLKDRINQLYFGILLIGEQLKLNNLVDDDLNSGIDKVNASIKNGIDFKSSLDKLKAELIDNKQRAIELQAQRKEYLDMLGYFVNKPIDENSTFEKPASPNTNLSINRPELTYYETINQTYSIQKKIIQNSNIPRLSVFLQGGVGQPNPMNMISNSFSPYYIGGIKLDWSFSNLYNQKNKKSLLDIDKSTNDLQKDIFVFNTNLEIKQQNNELTKLNKLISTDDELVSIRSSVKNTSKAQLENGVISANDYVKDVNAEDQSRQNKLLHEVQLLIAQYSLQNTTGN